jgi:DNA (cytosine-5)-methyltransferase 1|tara:strand:+ start:92 stop:853 length:762 start_codon:yes stop_codon:yes gene_type:complete
MTFGSLFSGIGGIDLGLERAGMECKWQVEIDPFCRKVLAKHWPDVRRFEDVKSVGGETLGPVDVIAGGFPCQDNSNSNQWWGEGRKGLEGDKSGLWTEMWRVACELQPQYIAVENVSALLTVNGGRDFCTILEQLAEGGYNAEWECLYASTFGAAHHRERIFLVAYPDSIRPEEIFSDRGRDVVPTVETELRNLAGATVQVGGAWASQPEVDIMAYGIPNRPRQLEALGNAVVPQCAEYIGRKILEKASETAI